VENQVGKNTGRRERIHYIQVVTTNSAGLYCVYNFSYPISLSLEEKVFVLNCWLKGGRSAGEIGITATIFMYGFVVMTEIVGA